MLKSWWLYIVGQIGGMPDSRRTSLAQYIYSHTSATRFLTDSAGLSLCADCSSSQPTKIFEPIATIVKDSVGTFLETRPAASQSLVALSSSSWLCNCFQLGIPWSQESMEEYSLSEETSLRRLHTSPQIFEPYCEAKKFDWWLKLSLWTELISRAVSANPTQILVHDIIE